MDTSWDALCWLDWIAKADTLRHDSHHYHQNSLGSSCWVEILLISAWIDLLYWGTRWCWFSWTIANWRPSRTTPNFPSFDSDFVRRLARMSWNNRLTWLLSSSNTWSYSLSATQKMIEVTFSKQWIHFLRSLLCPPTSNILRLVLRQGELSRVDDLLYA